MADLDHFKTLNDTHGHEAGDRALRVFAQTLRAHLRANDLACRYGGEEFLVILPETDTFDAIEIIERVRDALRAAAEHGGVPSVTASFGIAHSDDADDFDDLLRRADQALFGAKRGGRDLICLDGHDDPVAQNLTAIG
jgi:diguanylate cyclase (GGDEF)-like protein